MFCYKENCDLDISKFRKSNEDHDCFMDLLKTLLEHYNGLKKKFVEVETEKRRLERKFKRLEPPNVGNICSI